MNTALLALLEFRWIEIVYLWFWKTRCWSVGCSDWWSPTPKKVLWQEGSWKSPPWPLSSTSEHYSIWKSSLRLPSMRVWVKFISWIQSYRRLILRYRYLITTGQPIRFICEPLLLPTILPDTTCYPGLSLQHVGKRWLNQNVWLRLLEKSTGWGQQRKKNKT